jgi:hypothetical protein
MIILNAICRDAMEYIAEKCTEILNGIAHGDTKVLNFAVLGFASAAILCPIAYHSYLLCQFSGEVKVAFSWIPILGDALRFGVNPVGTIQQLSDDGKGSFKEIVGILLAGKRMFLINDPNSFKTVFKAKKEVHQRQIL